MAIERIPCPQCGEENLPENAFCPFCYAPLVPPKPTYSEKPPEIKTKKPIDRRKVLGTATGVFIAVLVLGRFSSKPKPPPPAPVAEAPALPAVPPNKPEDPVLAYWAAAKAGDAEGIRAVWPATKSMGSPEGYAQDIRTQASVMDPGLTVSIDTVSFTTDAKTGAYVDYRLYYFMGNLRVRATVKLEGNQWIIWEPFPGKNDMYIQQCIRAPHSVPNPAFTVLSDKQRLNLALQRNNDLRDRYQHECQDQHNGDSCTQLAAMTLNPEPGTPTSALPLAERQAKAQAILNQGVTQGDSFAAYELSKLEWKRGNRAEAQRLILQARKMDPERASVFSCYEKVCEGMPKP